MKYIKFPEDPVYFEMGGRHRLDPSKIEIYARTCDGNVFAQRALTEARYKIVQDVYDQSIGSNPSIPEPVRIALLPLTYSLFDHPFALIDAEPAETLHERARTLFETLRPQVLEGYREFMTEARNREALATNKINREEARRVTLEYWKANSAETPEETMLFARIMERALQALPGAEDAEFGILTPEEYYESGATGLFYPEARKIHVALSYYPSGCTRPVNDWFEDMAHEGAHAQGHDPEDKHGAKFRTHEYSNLKILQRLNIDMLAQKELPQPRQPPERKSIWRMSIREFLDSFR